jgi:hypothetical protein
MSEPRPRPPGMYRDPGEQLVSVAQAKVAWTLEQLQVEHGLTTVEMFQAITSWQLTALKYMLRAERGSPGEPAEDRELPDPEDNVSPGL